MTDSTGNKDQKLSEKIKELQKSQTPFFAFEYFPPKTQLDEEKLFKKVENLNILKPLYHDVAWGAAGASKEKDIVSLGERINKKTGNKNTQIHLTLTGMSKKELKEKLQEAKQKGVRNILAIRGDPPKNIYTDDEEESKKALENYWQSEYDDLRYAKDFIRFIRNETGDYFNLSAACYPEGHPKGNYDDDLKYVKEKADNGADFMVTQFFYDVDKFLKLKKDCEKLVPNVPIIPGILPIANFKNWEKLRGYCNVSLPEWMKKDLEKIDTTDKKAVSEFGINCCVKVCKELMKNGVKGFMFYTLNLTKSVSIILARLGMLDGKENKEQILGKFPWLKDELKN